MTNQVDTAKVHDRRRLRFGSIDEALADIDRIVDADAAGTLRRTGNWTAGQVFTHVAAWINYGYDGYPLGPPPWFIRIILRWQLKKYMRDGLPAGVRIPRIDGGTLGAEPLTTSDGADQLRKALRRLASDEPVRYDSPAFGPMSPKEVVVQAARLRLPLTTLQAGRLHYAHEDRIQLPRKS